MAKRKKRGAPGDKTICLPIAATIDYTELVENRAAYRQYLNQQIEQHPELFPVAIHQGYRFHGLVTSLRQELAWDLVRGHFLCARPLRNALGEVVSVIGPSLASR